jgi:hypothetical protein
MIFYVSCVLSLGYLQEYFTYKKHANTLLKYTKHMKKDPPNGYRHHHHLHICGFDFNLIINVQD